MSRVWQACKGQAILLPVFPESIRVFRAYHQDGRFPFYKFSLIQAQLRQMPTAKWSHKAAVEHQQYVRLSHLVRKADQPAIEIRQLKIWRRDFESNLSHANLPFLTLFQPGNESFTACIKACGFSSCRTCPVFLITTS